MPNPSDKPVPFRIRTDEVSKTVSFVFDPAPVIFPMNASQARAVAKKLNEKADIVDPPAKRKRTKAQPVDPPSLPSWLSEELWGRWVEHRQSIKKPLSHSGMAASIRVMDKLRLAGQDVEAVIDASIAGGYQGLFAIEGVLAVSKMQQPEPAKPIDAKRCLRCSGTGLYYPNGFGSGVAQCKDHEWAPDEPEVAPAEVVVSIENYVKKVGMR